MKLFKTIILLSLLLSSTFAIANNPLFVSPTSQQTGFYTVTNVEGSVEVPIQRTNITLEVIESGQVILGTLIPEGAVLLWGGIYSADEPLIFQSLIDFSPNYTHSFFINVAKVKLIDGRLVSVLVGSGELVFDPLYVGSGKVFDLSLNLISPIIINDNTYLGNVIFRAKRAIENVDIQACDRTGLVDFSPAPPITQCN